MPETAVPRENTTPEHASETSALTHAVSVADTGMFSQIHSADATLLAPGDVDNDGSDELAVSFAAAGTWIYDDDTGIFSQIHTVDAALLAAGDR